MTGMRRLAIALGLALVVASPHAQQPPAQPLPSQPPQTDPQTQQPTFRAGVRTVMVPVSVTDGSGQFVHGLVQDEFEVRDDSKIQDLTFFDQQVQPITAVLLLDGSASMLVGLKAAIAAANDFIVRLLPGDRLRLGSFSENIQLMPAFSGDRDELLSVFENEGNVRVGRRTRLWDAMYEGLGALAGIEGRRVLIVISDGLDTMSNRTFEEVEARAGRDDVAIYFARFHSRTRNGQVLELIRGADGSPEGTMKRLPPGGFEQLARDTGGGVIDVDQDYVTQAPFTEVALDLHSQYVIGFTPQTLDGKLHKLEVRVKRPKLAVRARQSYVASPNGG
jgi:Ca-activated chloride channel family protein